MFKYKDLKIRNIEESDLIFVQEVRNDPDTWMNLSYIGMFNLKNQTKWFEKISNSDNFDFFIIEDSKGNSIGYIRMDEIDRVNRSIRVGLDIHKDYRGKGHGKTTMKAILKYCFDYINMNRVWLLVLDYNEKASAIYKKSGFKVEGVMRQAIYRNNSYNDYMIMSILKEEYKDD